jgi:hypothetical protein
MFSYDILYNYYTKNKNSTMRYEYSGNIDRRNETSPKEAQQQRLSEAFEKAGIDVEKLTKIISKLSNGEPLTEEEQEIIRQVNESERGTHH